jgi:hypothetical protein
MTFFLDWLPDLSDATWAGLGALFAGIGSLLTGIAAVRRSKQEGKREAQPDRSDGGRPDAGGS